MKKFYKIIVLVFLLFSILSFGSCTFHYTESYAVSMKILTLPATRTYAIDEKIDISGLTVSITYVGGKALTVTPSLDMVEYDTSKLGKSSVRIYFEKVSAYYDINVVLPYDENIFVEVKNEIVNSEKCILVSMKLQESTALSSFQIDFVYDNTKFVFDSVLQSSSGISHNIVKDLSILKILYLRADMSSSVTSIIVMRLFPISSEQIVPTFVTNNAYKFIDNSYGNRQSVGLKYTCTFVS